MAVATVVLPAADEEEEEEEAVPLGFFEWSSVENDLDDPLSISRVDEGQNRGAVEEGAQCGSRRDGRGERGGGRWGKGPAGKGPAGNGRGIVERRVGEEEIGAQKVKGSELRMKIVKRFFSDCFFIPFFRIRRFSHFLYLP